MRSTQRGDAVTSPLLEVRDLAVVFDGNDRRTEAVRGVSFDLHPGELVGVVGESGCGKSVTARALLALVDNPGRILGGTVRLEGQDLLSMDERALRSIRGRRISMVFQDPITSLNPVFTIGQQLRMVMEAHGRKPPAERSVQLLRDVEIPAPEKRLRQYPHELSGGMRQRVMIAMALANEPALIIADEPTTALDVTIQAQILDLLRRINQENGTSILLISHSLDVVAEVADRVLVFYAGKIVEQGTTQDVFRDPAHPYTSALLRSMPRGDRTPLVPLAGAPPSLAPPPKGCAFAPRCPRRFESCTDDPSLTAVAPGHAAACWATVRDRQVMPATERAR
jgi:oligopeptide/dipeptide ABC transporter ATP-binding protein